MKFERALPRGCDDEAGIVERFFLSSFVFLTKGYGYAPPIASAYQEVGLEVGLNFPAILRAVGVSERDLVGRHAAAGVPFPADPVHAGRARTTTSRTRSGTDPARRTISTDAGPRRIERATRSGPLPRWPVPPPPFLPRCSTSGRRAGPPSSTTTSSRPRPRGPRDAPAPRLGRPVPGRHPVPDPAADALLDGGCSYAALGESAFATRLPVALSMVALVLLTFAFGRRFFGERAGRYAGLAIATSLGDVPLHAHGDPGSDLRARVHRDLLPVSSGPGREASIPVSATGRRRPLRSGGADARVDRRSFPGVRRRLPRLDRGVAAVARVAAAFEPRHLPGRRGPVARAGRAAVAGVRWAYFVNEHILRALGTRRAPRLRRRASLAVVVEHLVWLFPWSFFASWSPRVPATAAMGSDWTPRPRRGFSSSSGPA